jgi:CheY-like chemotaxis protein
VTTPKKPSHPSFVPPAIPSSRPSVTPSSVVPRGPLSGITASVKPPSNIKDAKTEAYAIAGGGLQGRSTAPSPIVGKKTVLIVDGDATIRASLKAQLDGLYNVAEAKDGMEAAEILPTLPNLGLVLSEVAMPRVDGFTLAKIIRANPNMKRVPIMFMSARNDPKDVTQALVLGVAHYFKKPTPAMSIVEKIRKVVV